MRKNKILTFLYVAMLLSGVILPPLLAFLAIREALTGNAHPGPFFIWTVTAGCLYISLMTLKSAISTPPW